MNKLIRCGGGMQLFIVVALLLVCSSTVSALGVAPSREIVDYKEGVLVQSARIINNDHADMRIAIYPKGELSEYVTINEDIVLVSKDEGEKTISYTVNLPADLEPGNRELGIVMVQLPDAFADSDSNLIITDEKSVLFENKDKDSLISATTAVIHQLIVRVPYPASHLEGRFYIGEGAAGDKMTFTVPVVNRGTVDTNAYAEIIIKGPTNEEITTFNTQTDAIPGGKEVKLVAEWTADVNQGKYIAEAIVHYGEDQFFTLSKEFHVGNVFVSIEGLSVEGFKLGGIAKFDVDIKNKWNQDMNEVYGELKILDQNGKGLATVKSLSANLPAYGTDVLNAYWDTTGVDVGRYDVNVVLHYAGKTTEKLFQTVVGIDKITVGTLSAKATGGESGGGNTTALLVILVGILILVNIGWFVFFRKRVKKT